MYEIDSLKYTIEQRDREIQYLINCVEKSNTELVNLKKQIHDNGQYVLIDVFKLARSIHDYNPSEDYVNVVETITNYVRLFECSKNVLTIQPKTETPIDNNSLKQTKINEEKYVVCDIEKLTGCIYNYNKELDFADIENIIINNHVETTCNRL